MEELTKQAVDNASLVFGSGHQCGGNFIRCGKALVEQALEVRHGSAVGIALQDIPVHLLDEVKRGVSR